MDILLIALLTLLNGAFAMSELALTASRKLRLMTLADEGDGGAKAAVALLEDPTRFLSSVQVGITSIGMLNGILGEAAFSEPLSQVIEAWGVPARAANITATAFVVTIITFTTIVFGELVPKRIGQLYPETVARWVSRPMVWVAKITKPFVWLLSTCTHAVMHLLRIDTAGSRSMTEAEINASLEEGVDAGVIEERERQMVQNVFLLEDRPLTSMMVPRSDVQWLEASHTIAQSLEKVSVDTHGNSHSWYPVCRSSLDDVVGMLSIATLLHLARRPDERVEDHLQPAVFVPETLSGMELITQFRESPTRVVMVVDEYGVIQGMISPIDMLEAITGELQSRSELHAWATLNRDGSWQIDGAMPVDEFKTRLDIAELPDQERGRYNTVAGLLMAVSGQLAETGEVIECAGWSFEVVELDGRRIDKVVATRLHAPASDASDRD